MEKYGRMQVQSTYKNKKYIIRAICLCDCGKVKDVNYYDLKNRKILSCGCLKKELLEKRNEKVERIGNEYQKIKGGFSVSLRNSKNFFIIDTADYKKIKKFTWRLNTSGYVVTTIKSKEVSLHSFLFNFPKEIIDHKDRNKLNNKRKNLRTISARFSAINKNVSKSNTSGIIGVNKNKNGWSSRISSELGKREFLGVFIKFEDAVFARLSAEKKYYGEYSPQKHLFEKYGV